MLMIKWRYIDNTLALNFLPGKVSGLLANFDLFWRIYCFGEMNTLRPKQNGCHFADDIFKYISWMNTYEFRSRFSLNNILTWAQIMNWRRTGDKPLSEPMMVSLPTHICVCVSRPQWVKLLCFSNQLDGFTATWKIENQYIDYDDTALKICPIITGVSQRSFLAPCYLSFARIIFTKRSLH